MAPAVHPPQRCSILIFMTLTAFLSLSSSPLCRRSFVRATQQVCQNGSKTNRCSSTKMSASTDRRPQSYEKLTSLYRDISSISDVLGLLSWDEQVMMPKGSSDSRGKQKAVLASILHDKSTSAELHEAINQVKQDMSDLNEHEKAVIRDIEREYYKKINIPGELERQMAQHESECVQKWIECRKNNDFESFIPSLTKTFKLVKEKATAMDPKSTNLYDVNIDLFERGMSNDRLKEIFDMISGPLKSILTNTLNAKEKCQRKVHPALIGNDNWTVKNQQLLCNDICEALGFNFDNGRIDESVHPFTGGAGNEDVRITTRYSTDIPFEGIMGTIHEVGHAMYEQGRNKKYNGLPVNEALSMGAHESQSLFWERMIGQNQNFWKFILPKVHERFPHTKESNVTSDDLYFAINQVNPGFIRVDADELTYSFHIIMRFELERRIMLDQLEVKDLSSAWNKSMAQYMNLTVDNDSKGVLQDIHWPSSAIGYFPSYSLGAMMAAQLFNYLKSNVMTDIETKIGNGDLSTIREWLNKEIHQVGSLYPCLDDLLIKVTGEPLNPQYFLDYLEQKYSKIYEN